MPGFLLGISVFNPGFPGFFTVDRLGLSNFSNKLQSIRSRYPFR